MPEPWRVERVYSNGCEVCPRIMAGREIVAEVCGEPHIGFVDTLPRAHLIAATQELFEACRMFIAWDENAHSTEADASAVRRAMAVAIAKATQETPA
jgi:hypothetical protein